MAVRFSRRAARGHARRACATSLLATGALVAVACARDGEPPPATLYSLVPADVGSSAAAGTIARNGLAVTVLDPSGAHAAGVRVRFRVTDGSSRMRDSIVASGPDGVARGEAVLRAATGTAAFIAFVPGQEADAVALQIAATDAPVLTSVAPSTFAAGDTIVLRGAALSRMGGAPSAMFGSLRGEVVAVSGDSVARAIVPACTPAGATSVRLVSTTGATAAIASTVTPRASLTLAVGQAALAPANSGCVTLPADGGEYLVVPQFAGVPAGSHSAQSFLLSVGDGVTGAVTNAVSRTTRSVPARFEAFLRERERTMAPLAARASTSQGVALEALTVGGSRTFNVINNLCVQQSGGCGLSFGSVRATLRFLGDHVAIYVDDAQLPGAALGDDELQRFGALFDRTLYQIDVQTFGSESDIDGNGHVIVLMTPSVNALTSAADCASGGYVAGFFFSDDLSTRASHSNRGEVFYTLAPDPSGARSCAHSADVVKRLAPATFIHEFQHMISFNQHAIVRGGEAEDPWLNEGLSHIAEELGARYYEGLLPWMQPSAAGRAKTSPAQLFPDSASDFITSNVRNAYGYLASPSTNSLTDFSGYGSLEERGGAWLFLRWLADQKGDAILSRLEQTSRTGTANVADKAGESFPTLFNDFALATYADSLPGVSRDKVPMRYHFAPNRNLRTLFGRLASTFPIVPADLPADGVVQRDMLPGAMSFQHLSARTSGVPQLVRFSAPGGGSFPADLGAQVGLLRVR